MRNKFIAYHWEESCFDNYYIFLNSFPLCLKNITYCNFIVGGDGSEMAEQLLFNDNNVHHLAYKCIIDWKPLWDLTTNRYKGFVMHHFKDYYEKETNMKLMDYYYLELYNIYINYYKDGK